MMLARVADSLYWIGRYLERAEHVARVCDVMLNATLDHSEAAARTAQIALAAVGQEGGPASPYDAAKALTLDRANAGSALVSLARARENARQVRDQITTETWERINLVYLKVTAPEAADNFEAGSSAFLHDIIADLHQFKGAADATMSHGEGWRFLMLGAYLERAQLIARLLEASFGNEAGARPADHVALMAVLRMACALEPYLRTYTAEIQPRFILEFLLFDEDFPRSIRFATERIEANLADVTNPTDGAAPVSPGRLAGRLRAHLQYADPSDVSRAGAGALLGDVLRACAEIHQAIHETHVAYPLEMRLPA